VRDSRCSIVLQQHQRQKEIARDEDSPTRCTIYHKTPSEPTKRVAMMFSRPMARQIACHRTRSRQSQDLHHLRTVIALQPTRLVSHAVAQKKARLFDGECRCVPMLDRFGVAGTYSLVDML
jgi:hypothetical protein